MLKYIKAKMPYLEKGCWNFISESQNCHVS